MNTLDGDDKFTQQPVARQLMFVVLGTGVILLVPMLAMLFPTGVDWDLFDFALMGTLLMGIGVTFVFSARIVRSTQHRIVLGAVLSLALLLAWVELAVGVFGSPFAGS